MPKLFEGRGNRFGAGALSLLLVTLVVVVATNTDGYRARHVDLDDATVWISGRHIPEREQQSAIGRVNTEISRLDLDVEVSAESTLYQDDDTTLYLSGSGLTSYDGATHSPRGQSELQRGAAVAIGGGTVAMVAPDGSLWASRSVDFEGFAKGDRPQAKVDAGSLLVVGVDGVATTYRPGARRGYRVGLDGSRQSWAVTVESSTIAVDDIVDAASGSAPVELSTVGSTPVVLDRARGQLAVADGPVASVAKGAELQQPGPDNSTVTVASSTGLVQVAMSDGTAHSIEPRGPRARNPLPTEAREPVRPVVVDGCTYGAWHVSAWELRFCSGDPGRSFSGALPQAPTDPDLVFRSNHNRVVLNDIESGDAWVLDDSGALEMVTGWEQADEDERKDDEDDKIDLPEPERDCKADERPDARLTGEVPPVEVGARVGVPTRVSLGQIPNLPAPRCRVLQISEVSLDEADGTVVRSATGDTLEFTMARPGVATAHYRVDDGTPGGEAAGSIRIDARPHSSAGNRKPETNDDRRAPTFAVAGQTTSYNALDVASDPDGDPVNLVDACIGDRRCLDVSMGDRPAADGTVQFQPDGWIRYTAPKEGKGSKNKLLSFRIADQWGEMAEGSVNVSIQELDRVAPVTHDDRARVIAGQRTVVDVLGNDVSPAGRPLKLKSVTVEDVQGLSEVAASAVLQQGESGTDDAEKLVVTDAATPGSILARYVVDDGMGVEAEGFVRLTVTAAEDLPVPVAMRDLAVARPKAQVMVNVLANDFDDAGGVLAVRSVRTEHGAAQLMRDARSVRVTAPDGFIAGSAPMVVTYEVSNGYKEATGTLVVSPSASSENLAPFTRPDGPVSIRAGMVTSIPVLANDIDPEGGSLYLKGVDELDPSQGTAFVQGDQIRFVAPTGGSPGPITFRYTVSDEPLGTSGNEASGEVTVQIIDPATPNREPRSLQLTARAVRGETTRIEVPLLAADPDGDIVGIVGVSRPASKGTVKVDGNEFEYTPFDDDDVFGTDTFSFRLADGKATTESTVRVGVVAPVPSTGPVATPIKVVVKPGHQRTIDLLAPESVTSTARTLRVQASGKNAPFLSPEGKGKILGEVTEDGAITYQAPDDVGTTSTSATLTYVVQDSSGSQVNFVVITIDPAAEDQPPAARDDFVVQKAEGEEVEIDLLSNDSDPGGSDVGRLDLEATGLPEGASLTNGVVRFDMPNRGVRFLYRITDPDDGRTAQAIVSVPLKTGVTCEPDAYTGTFGQSTPPIDVLGRCSGPSGARLKLVGTSVKASVGRAKIKAQKVVVTFREDVVSGEYALDSQVCVDGPDCTNTTVVVTDQLRVEGNQEEGFGNVPPVLNDGPVVPVPYDGEASVDLVDRVEDENPGDAQKVRFSLSAPTVKGGVTARLAGSVVTFTAGPQAEVDTELVFRVGLNDGNPDGEATGTVTVKVARPVVTVNAIDDAKSVLNTETPRVTVWDDLVDNDVVRSASGEVLAKRIVSVGGAAPGAKVELVDGKVAFTPVAGFGGDTSFSYTIAPTDPDAVTGTGANPTATVTVHVVGLPATPGAPVAHSVTAGQATVDWVAPSGNGGPIDLYEVQCRLTDTKGSCPTKTVDSGTSTTYLGLTNGQGHQFRVRAHNEAGFSKWSEYSAPVTPDRLPAPPTLVDFGLFDGSCTPSGCGPNGSDGVGQQLTVRWTQPAFDGSPVTRYKVHVNGGNPGEPVRNGSVWSSRITGLTNGTQYTVWVSAVNGAGEYPTAESAPVTMSQTPAGVPGPVGGIVVDGNTEAEVLQVSWSQPPGNGAPPTVYKVSATPVGGGNTVHQDDVDGTSARIPGVTAGQVYDVSVAAKNKSGWGSAGSGTGQSFKPPAPVTGLTATPDDAAAILRFTPPSDTGGSPIVGYLVDDGVSSQMIASDGASEIRLDRPNGQLVGPFRLRVCNQWSQLDPARCSAPATAGAVTPFGPPEVQAVSAGGGAVNVTWSAVGAQATYEVDCGANGTLQEQSTGTAVCKYPLGPARTFTIKVTATSQNVSQETTVTGTTTDTRRIEVSWGGPATHAINGEECESCRWVDATLEGFDPSEDYEISWMWNLKYETPAAEDDEVPTTVWSTGPVRCVATNGGACWTLTVRPDPAGRIVIRNGVVTVGIPTNGAASFSAHADVSGVIVGFDLAGLPPVRLS